MTTFQSNLNFSFNETCHLPYPEYERDVVAVLDSVKILFSKYFNSVDDRQLIVENYYPSAEYPMMSYDKIHMFLSVSPFDDTGKPSCYWSQFIYQFSHELCHFMVSGQVVRSMRWFEESLCELASHFFLLKSAERWAVLPPYPQWREYSSHIFNYELSSRHNAAVFDLMDLSRPSFPLLMSLEQDAYQRPYNRHVALELLPLFIDKPSLWKIVPHLSEIACDNSLGQNLQLLESLSEQNLSSIKTLFGFLDD